MPGAPPSGENQTRVDNPTYQETALPTYSSVSGIPHQSWVRVGFFQLKSSRKSAFLISSQVTSQMHH